MGFDLASPVLIGGTSVRQQAVGLFLDHCVALAREPFKVGRSSSYNSLQSPATLNEIDDDNHDGNDQENVNESAKRV
jgi:hypothetical protein